MGVDLSDNPEERARQEAELFLRDQAPRLGRLFGMDLDLSIGDGWATNLETGEVTVDLKFFLERGYTPDMAVYAILHETAAHLREVVNEPKLTNRVIEFVKKGPAESIFHNIMSDIAGNNLIHAQLPRMQHVAEKTYQQKLFPDNLEMEGQTKSYADLPRHLQFLYKLIREEMIPGSQTEVLPEVDEAMQSLRDYKGRGDLIKYSTAVSKTNAKTGRREYMKPQERFAIWTEIVYPVYQQLIELDKQDPPDKGESSDQSGDGSGSGDESQPSHGTPGQEQERPEDQKKSEGDQPGGDFQPYYDDYFENRHPEPMSEEDHDKLHEYAKKQSEKKKQRENINPLRELDKKIRQETGHSLAEKKRYETEMMQWRDAIQRMREVYQAIINERVSLKRGLSRRPMTEGAVLDPDRLPQTIIDMKAGVTEPEAFRDYEQHKGRTEVAGKTDYIFIFDQSGSMGETVAGSSIGTKSQAAAACSVIALEGLSAMQSDIEAAEAEYNLDLELEIRTAIYTFGSDVRCLKPLSSQLDLKERLDTYSDIRALEGSTADFLAMEEVSKLPMESDRRRIVIVVSDGGSDNPTRARQVIESLRRQGCLVYGISIGSNEAERLYAPTAKRVDNPDNLPETIEKFIEDTIS